jgi:hypothetical protein
MDPIEKINQLKKEASELPDILAPMLTRGGSVTVMFNNHPYRFKTNVTEPGWYILHPNSPVSATYVRSADFIEVRKFLDELPHFRVISMRRVNGSRWLVFPFNVSEAEIKNIKVIPTSCFLVSEAIEPFSVVLTRVWGDMLLYDTSIDSMRGHKFKTALNEELPDPPKVPDTLPEFKIVYKLLANQIIEAKKKSIKTMISDAVGFLGGNLVGFNESGNGYIINWNDGKTNFETRVDGDLRVTSSGICLSGRDSEQTMSSIVSVMRKYSQRYNY